MQINDLKELSVEDKKEPLIVIEDLGEKTLEVILGKEGLPIQLFLTIAIQLSEKLITMHSKGIFYGQITPENILVDIENQEIKITGIRGVSYTSEDNLNHHSWRGNQYSTAYISPEQTGRLKQGIDHRTDFYSLGIVFYQMLTGILPFQSEDYVEIAYYHLASEAIPLHQYNSDIPVVISNIINKLMEKKVEKRYQAAAELKEDLLKAYNNIEIIEGRVQIKGFDIDNRDDVLEHNINNIFVGREAEEIELMRAFNRVKDKGKPLLIFIYGSSGVGKTTFVNECSPSIKALGGTLIQGKYNQYMNSTPYFSIIHAFDSFFNGILLQGRDSVAKWRDKFEHALGINASIITNIFNRLSKIIGFQAEVEELPFTEAQNRFNNTIIDFLKVVATKESPLVVFLDDLQWMDESSKNFIEIIISGIEDVYILLIGAYRDNEVLASGPINSLVTMTEEVRNVTIAKIHLTPLNPLELGSFIEKLFSMDEEAHQLLVKICYEKSGGNPLFLYQFVKSLMENKIIDLKTGTHKWMLDTENVLKYASSSNILDLITNRLQKVSRSTVELLEIAACCNEAFERGLLSRLQGIPIEVVDKALEEALEEGLIQPQEENLYEEIDSKPKYKYKFIHDRVQQAVYLQLDENQRKDFHYRIGKQLLETNKGIEENNNLFEIIEHLNSSIDIIKSNNEHLLLAHLNLRAAKKAKGYRAYDRALDYLVKGIEIIGEEGWSTRYELALGLYKEVTATAYICGKYKLMEEMAEIVLKQAKSLIDKAHIYEIKIEYLTVVNQLEDAIDIARQVLKLFNIIIPVKPTRQHIMKKYLKIRLNLIRYSFDDIKAMPEMENQEHLTIMRIITSAGIAAFTYYDNVYMMLVLYLIEISLKFGIAPSTPVGFASFGHFLCGYLKRRKTGYQFAKLAMELQEQMKSKTYECKTTLIFEIVVRHNIEPISNTLTGFPLNHRKGLNSGDLTSAGHIMMQHFVYMYLAGKELKLIIETMLEYREELIRTGNRTAISVCNMYLQGFYNLSSDTEKPWELKGEYFNETTELAHYIEFNDKSVVFNNYFNKMIISYTYGEYNEALKNLKGAVKYDDGAIGTYCIPLYNFYGALIHLALLSSSSTYKDKYYHKRKYKNYLGTVKSYYKDAPENNGNKLCLILGEEARINSNYDSAIDYYLRSIELSSKHGFLLEEALGKEVSAKLFIHMNKEKMAVDYYRGAINSYKKWGATGKVKELLREQQEILAINTGNIKGTSSPIEESISSINSLDIEAIIRSSQTISEEIVLPEILKKMIKIVLQNAGACKALFIMETDGELYVEAQGQAKDSEVKIERGAKIVENQNTMDKLINYVLNTRESILLNSEAQIESFIGDIPVEGMDSRSLLCMPVESKRSLVGIMYLENNLIDGAFNQQHLIVLRILVAQFAISIENARLYQNMEMIVDERTQEIRKKNKELEFANTNLERANQIKNQFLANMSHEMRTPLHGIIGMAKTLQRSNIVMKDKELINTIIASGRSLIEIINEILDFSKIEADKIELEEQYFYIEEIIRDLLPTFTLRAEDKGIELNYIIDQKSNMGLKGDVLRIKQIINNLISNAIKFTEKGKVELEILTEVLDTTTVMLEIIVSDTGIGIHKDKLEFIFQDFVQADSSTTRKYGGTGLGLSITKRLVNMMKGSIEVKSTLGIGSVFDCRLYLNAMDIGEGTENYRYIAEETALPEENLSLKVLVAEDNTTSQKYIRRLLEYLGCSVTLAADGREVLNKLRIDKFDCVIMDKNMPLLDGIEATNIIRSSETENGYHIPIIGLTASVIEGERENLLSAGMDYYLTKPLKEEALVTVLKNIGKSVDIVDTLESKYFSEETLINKDILYGESELYGREIILEIISDFLESYTVVLERVEGYIEKENFSAVEKEVHKFASTASIFQCNSYVKVLRKMEAGAATKETDLLKNNLPILQNNTIQLVNELLEVKSYLMKI